MTYYIIESIKKYVKSVTGLNSVVYTDSEFDITSTLTINPKSDVISPATTFIMEDNDDGAVLTSSLLDKYLYWSIRYTGGSYDKFIPITAYNNLTGQVTIGEAFANDVLTSDTLQLVVSSAVYIDSGVQFQPYMKINATEEKLPIYLRFQTRRDSIKETIRDNAFLVKANLIKIKKRLPIYDNVGDICGYMKITSSINTTPARNDGDQIQVSTMSFTVSYTMNYKI